MVQQQMDTRNALALSLLLAAGPAGTCLARPGRAAAFLCRNATCLPPVNTATELEGLLETPGSLDTNSAPDRL